MVFVDPAFSHRYGSVPHIERWLSIFRLHSDLEDTEMKFVALISGGKDSFYNIHHCISQGHELIALANLYPAAPDRDEIDSFMFQTVGHDIIDSYSECVGVPLYRQKISGTSKNQHLEYSKTKEDEIEDLYILLDLIKQKHPEVVGVSCGAILSHYQRTRVESVCGRLGLTSLTYLWQRNQLELMGEMCNSGLDARIIKVAAIGLNETHLGKSIQQLYPQLIKLNQMYDVHICGEGGEFETIVLDASFFKKRLVVVHKEVVADSTDDVSYLRIKVELEDKEEVSKDMLESPSLLDEMFEEIKDELENSETKPSTTCSNIVKSTGVSNVTSVVSTPDVLYISNLTSPKELTIQLQTLSIFEQLKKLLDEHNLSVNYIKHVTLLLSDMSQFSQINDVYAKFFEEYYLPPSRICVGTELPEKTLVQLSCEVILASGGGPLSKEGIHIRSRSYWAPHNIGPYSQSIVERHPDYLSASLSGQIPLIPSTMDFLPSNSEESGATIIDSALSLQHLHRVMELIKVCQIGSIICFVTDSTSVQLASATWDKYISSVGGNQNGTLVIVQVKQLPRGATIEWGGFSYENIVGMYEDDDEEEKYIDRSNLERSKVDLILKETSMTATAVQNIGRGKLFATTTFSNDHTEIDNFLRKASGKVQILANMTHIGSLKDSKQVEFTPVDNVYDHNGTSFKFGVVWKYYS
ncbi:diphthine--ammonia ligase [[Candida] anglica]|uniref:Diphthine--ammonia ligase n=1 Tax=[Candida] anglica TaxID=148631 RepID=A0ABP0EKD8_9ASCO